MHIYFHIPFCTSLCPYCAFASFDKEFSSLSAYFQALNLELDAFLAKKDIKEIKTIFFGGGTPSSVPAKFYYEIFEKLRQYFSSNIEITFEANPNSAKEKWLKEIKALGANRLSLGSQSFDEEKLKFLGRQHSGKDTVLAVERAKKAGFENINVDIIYSTKFDSKEFLKGEIEKLKNLELSHISAYSLTLEEGTDFGGKISFVKDSEEEAEFLIQELEKAGFPQYEISNFGKICQHNLAYWQGKEYYSFGLSSVSFYDKKRFYASENLEEYLKNPLARKIEKLSKNDLRLEAIFLGTRSLVGIKEELLTCKEKERAKFLEKEGKIFFQKGKFFNKNYLVADEVALYISE